MQMLFPPLRLSLLICIGASCWTQSPVARAQGKAPSDLERSPAQRLDAEGRALLKERKFEEACPKLAESFRLRPRTDVLLRLALCQELSGKGARAWESYRAAAQRTHHSGEASLRKLAQERGSALASRLSRLTLHLDASAREAPDLEVRRDGIRIERSALGVAYPVDPGPHVIEATARGRKRFEGTIDVSETPKSYWVTVILPPEVARSPKAYTSTSANPTATPHQALAVAAGCIGIAGIAAGTIFRLQMASKMDRARAACRSGAAGCPAEALALQDEARTSELTSNIALGVGGAGLAGGLALWLLAPKPRDRPLASSLRAAPIAGPGVAGIVAEGAW